MQISKIINNSGGSAFYSPDQTRVQGSRDLNRAHVNLDESPKGQVSSNFRAFVEVSQKAESTERNDYNNRVNQVKELSRSVSTVMNRENTIDHKILIVAMGAPPKSFETVKNLGSFIDRWA